MPPSSTDQQLADEIRQTNKSLAEAVAALRAEGASLREALTAAKGELKVEMATIRGDIKTEVAKITTSMAWMKGLVGVATTIIGVSLASVALTVYRAGQRDERIDIGVAALQKNAEESRSDLKARDKSLSDTLEGMRKSSDEVRIVVKGLTSDMTGIRSSVDHLNESMSRLPLRPR